MGADAAVTGIVTELLPYEKVRVRLENESLVTAHAAGAAKVNFVRLRPGDRVEVVLAPHDPGRGRIVKLVANPRP
jgi:translation initiation factor IF-1